MSVTDSTGRELKEHDRIELLAMPNDPAPIPVGSRGTVAFINELMDGTDSCQLWVEWDSGRSLMLLYPIDRFRILSEG